MNCHPAQKSNPVERFVGCFPTVREAAEAAGVTTEMLRRMRRQGFVSTRERALLMAGACKDRVSAVDLLAVKRQGRAA